MNVRANVPGHPEPMPAPRGRPRSSAEQCRRFGNRLLTVLLGREGQRVNARCVCPSSGVTAVPPLGGVEGGG
jgi:hypothetical protein